MLVDDLMRRLSFCITCSKKCVVQAIDKQDSKPRFYAVAESSVCAVIFQHSRSRSFPFQRYLRGWRSIQVLADFHRPLVDQI